MKFNFKSFITGIATTAIIGSLSITALAVTGQISFNKVNLAYNGQPISKSGENYALQNGTHVPASIIYTDENGGGTTYLPIRRISDLLDVNIEWEQKSNSVVVETNEYVAGKETAINTITYDEFKAMWYVKEQFPEFPTDGNYRIYRASYNGVLSYEEFKEYLKTLNHITIRQYAEKLALEYLSLDANHDVNMPFAYHVDKTPMAIGSIYINSNKEVMSYSPLR